MDNPEKLAIKSTQDGGKTKQKHYTLGAGHLYT